MDSMNAFMMGQANRGKELMVFDWDRAATIIKDKNATQKKMAKLKNILKEPEQKVQALQSQVQSTKNKMSEAVKRGEQQEKMLKQLQPTTIKPAIPNNLKPTKTPAKPKI